MRKSWKTTKYRFWLQKGVKIQNQYHFWKLWTLIIWKFYHYFSRQFTLKGSTAKSIFFFSVLCGKAEKRQNTFFGYKKWSKSESDEIFKSATPKFHVFHFLIFLSNRFFFLVGSHGFRGLFGAFCVAWLLIYQHYFLEHFKFLRIKDFMYEICMILKK